LTGSLAFSRILIPTDGSALARKGIKSGVAFAKALGAQVVGYHAVEPIERIY
jgi:nucleotide-binding universal stress UspA family protein